MTQKPAKQTTTAVALEKTSGTSAADADNQGGNDGDDGSNKNDALMVNNVHHRGGRPSSIEPAEESTVS